MNKIELIEKIVLFHPSSQEGAKLSLCEYTGGMKDSGQWFWPKMARTDIKILKQLLKDLRKEFKPKPPRIYTAEEQLKLKVAYPNVKRQWITNVLEQEEIRDFCNDQERKLLNL